MDKVYTYLMLIVSVSLFLYMSGLGSGTNMFSLVLDGLSEQTFLKTENISNNWMWGLLIIVFVAIGLGIAYQSVIAGNASAAITAGLITVAFSIGISFIGDVIYILTLAENSCDITGGVLCSVPYYIIFAICSFLVMGFVWSLGQLVFGGGD